MNIFYLTANHKNVLNSYPRSCWSRQLLTQKSVRNRRKGSTLLAKVVNKPSWLEVALRAISRSKEELNSDTRFTQIIVYFVFGAALCCFESHQLKAQMSGLCETQKHFTDLQKWTAYKARANRIAKHEPYTIWNCASSTTASKYDIWPLCATYMNSSFWSDSNPLELAAEVLIIYCSVRRAQKRMVIFGKCPHGTLYFMYAFKKNPTDSLICRNPNKKMRFRVHIIVLIRIKVSIDLLLPSYMFSQKTESDFVVCVFELH